MFTDGIKRIIASAKVQLLTSAAFGAVMTYLMTPGTPVEKRGLLETMVYALAALVGTVILGWAHEDASAKKAPQNQTNVNSDVTNQPVIATPALEPEPLADVLSPAQIDALYVEIRKRAAVASAAAKAAKGAP